MDYSCNWLPKCEYIAIVDKKVLHNIDYALISEVLKIKMDIYSMEMVIS